MKKKYRDIKLSAANRTRLQMINGIITEYQRANYVLTLRQLYYQLVTRDVIPNNVKEYAKLSTLLKEGRMGGIVDWNAIEDRLRVPSQPSSFESPEQILDACINQYELPRMDGQPVYVEVWVEKDALSGVLKRVTEPFHIPILVNRGYSSVSAMHEAYKRFKAAYENDQHIRILYLGDFDPSGMDMLRDIKSRILEFFVGEHCNDDDDLTEQYWERAAEYLNFNFDIVPVALTRQQIRQYTPPPNPAKISDPRAAKFIEEHGASSWEVDALKPEVLDAILTKAIKENIDEAKYKKKISEEKKDIKKLQALKEYL
jgi:hypothetical protein